ncbi:MAG: hypothetical protein ACOYLS_01450 [Polymorphobacter sp.]
MPDTLTIDAITTPATAESIGATGCAVAWTDFMKEHWLGGTVQGAVAGLLNGLNAAHRKEIDDYFRATFDQLAANAAKLEEFRAAAKASHSLFADLQSGGPVSDARIAEAKNWTVRALGFDFDRIMALASATGKELDA